MSLMMHDWVTHGAERRPDARALIGDDRTMSYGELERYSSRLANVLREAGCAAGDRVGILMPKSALGVAAFIAVLKAGCVYVPLDPKGGNVRRGHMVRQCAPRFILAADCDPGVLDDLDVRGALAGTEIGWLSDADGPRGARFGADDVRSASDEAPPRRTGPDDLAYVLFTSGTTGLPKGVPITHASVRAFIEWAVEYFGLGPGDRLSGHTALTFDLSTFDIYATLAAGAELHQVPERVLLKPHDLPAFIDERELTLWFSVPSQLAYIARFDALDGRTLDSVRHVAWCGDVLAPPALAYWRDRVRHAAYTNLYGPTEATVASSHYRVPEDHDPEHDVPIGHPCPGEELLVLDERLRPVPDGEVGDLYIRGVGLSPGYWKEPERSREAFLHDPYAVNGDGRIYRTGDRARRSPDGTLHFLGRADFQIKTSGYRVEPAEVECAVRGLPEVQSCAVVPVKVAGFQGSAIGCAYVPSNGAPLRTAEAKRRLADALPGYMIPSLWLVLEELPVDGRGKIDRKRVQALMGGGGS